MKIEMYEGGQISPAPAGRARVWEKTENGITAVYISALGQSTLDPDDGARVWPDTPEITRWMADFRHCEFWCMPGFGEKLCDVPDETQLLLCGTKDGEYIAYLPLVANGYKCVLMGTPEGLCVRVFAWTKRHSLGGPVLVYKTGKNPYTLVEELTKEGLRLSGRPIRMREDRKYPEIFEYLGWCSWDSMQIRVNEDGVLEKCREFRDKEIPVRWMILDDMWADVPDFKGVPYKDFGEMVRLMHSSRLNSFEADPERFPHGLKYVIQKARDEYGIRTGMWHPTTGYWYGVTKEGPIYQKLGDKMLELEDGRIIPHYETGKAFAFYDAFHSYLEDAGAVFVKVDNQSQYRRFYKGMTDVDDAARQYHKAIEASVGIHFGGDMINCMGCASEDWWSRPNSCVTRCSDDFLPENRDWFTKHITQCSFTCFAQSPLTWCDWDMWWTDDGQAVKNSVLRAISGGPIYVSDQLARSNADILKPLCMSDGKILRCDKPAAPARDSLLMDPQKSGQIFKIQNTARGAGILAVFDLDKNENEVSGYISPSDVENLEYSDEGYLVYECFSGKWMVMKREDKKELVLRNRDHFMLFNIIPIHDGFAPLGLKGKFVAPASIGQRIGENVELLDHGTYLYYKDGKLEEKTC